MPSVAVRHRDVLSPTGNGQVQFATDWTSRFVFLEGGWGSGKSFIGALKLLRLHLHNARRRNPLTMQFEPTFCKSAIIGPTYKNLFDTDVPLIEDHCKKLGLSYVIKRSHEISEIHLLDLGFKLIPSKILLRTADRPDLITGWEVGAFWCDESSRYKEDRANPKNDPIIQVMGRLREPKARVKQGMFTYTNEGDNTRTYELCHGGLEEGSYGLYRARTKENPHVAEFYESMSKNLPPDLVRQYLEGEAVSRSGAKVYSAYERARNVNIKMDLATTLPLHISVDFNISPGMHMEIGQHWPERDFFYVRKEIHRPRLSVVDMVEDFKIWIGSRGGWKWPELHVFGDASGESKWAGTGESCFKVLAQGLDTIKGVKWRFRVPASNGPVIGRVNAFNMALRDFEGNAHWACHTDCPRLIDDLQRLKYNDKGEIDKRHKAMSHPSDAEGYRLNFLRPVRVSVARTYGQFSVMAGGGSDER